MKYIYKIQWYTRKIRIKAHAFLVNLIQKERNQDIENTLLVIGTTRSGTTYLMENLNRHNTYRLIFEPFVPEYTKEWKAFGTRHYVSPECATDAEKQAIETILSGDIRNKWVDQFNKKLTSDHRLIKAVRANQLIPFIRDQYPTLNIIYLIRDPYQVVASRMSLDFTPEDVYDLLSNKEFMSTHYKDIDLTELEGLLTSTASKHASLWALENRFLMKNIEKYNLHLLNHKEIIDKEISFTNGKLMVTDAESSPISVSTSPRTKKYVLTDSERKEIEAILDLFGMD